MRTACKETARGRPWAVSAFSALAVLGLLSLADGQSSAWGGFSGRAGGSGTFRSGTQLLSDTIGASGCASSPNGAGAITSNQTACPTYPLASTLGTSTTVSLANQGSVAPTSATVSTTGTCGVQQFADTSAAGSQTALALGGVGYGAAGPTQFSGSPVAATFDGSTGYLETLNQLGGPQTFSLAGWFKTGTATGSIIGFTNAQGGSGQTEWDRMLWLDSSGHVVFGVYPNTAFEVNSDATTSKDYADGNWHFVVATVSPVSATVGTVELYVDGALVAGSSGDETIAGADPAQAYNGYWHLGWSNASQGWTDGPTGGFWSGSLAGLAVFPSALSGSQVAALGADASQAAFGTQVVADAATSYWSLQDTGTSLYTGPIADVPGNPASVTFPDLSGRPGTDTGTAAGTLGVDPAGPFADSATTFDGSTGYLETLNQLGGPQTFSLAGWFKTGTATGSIIGFTNAQGGSGQTEWDRMLWLDSSGHVVFGVYPNTAFEVNSDATTSKDYADGNWHFVVATVSPVSATVGTVELYVDGALVAGSSGDETIAGADPAQAYNGYWHLGWSNASQGWTDGPTGGFWSGSLAGLAVFPSALSGSQVAALGAMSNGASYQTAVTGGIASSNAYWPLDHNGLPSSPACTYLTATISAGASCIYPVSGGTCPTGTASWLSVASAPIPTSLPSLTFTTAGYGTVPAAAEGLHVSVPWQISDGAGGFTSSLRHVTGYVLL